jgi:hypothetical protein
MSNEVVRIGTAGRLKDIIRTALSQEPGPFIMRIMCVTDGCGTTLAKVQRVPEGVLFLSAWRAPGQSLSGPWRRREVAPELYEYKLGREHEQHLCADVLDFTLGPGEPGHPDLFVRCTQHGDAVLDRADVRQRWECGENIWRLALRGPRMRYAFLTATE